MSDWLAELKKRVTPLENVADAGEVVAYRVPDEDFAWLVQMAQRAETLAGMLDEARAALDAREATGGVLAATVRKAAEAREERDAALARVEKADADWNEMRSEMVVSRMFIREVATELGRSTWDYEQRRELLGRVERWLASGEVGPSPLDAALARAASLDADLRKMAHAWRTAEARVAALVQTVSEAHGIPWESPVDVAVHIGNAVANTKADLAGVTRERDAALARVAALEAVLAEPSNPEEMLRLMLLVADHTGVESRGAVRAILADLRQRAGVTP